MALVYTKNLTIPGTWYDFIYQLKTALIALTPTAWSLLGTSDGTTYSPTGDQITSSTVLSQANAWFRIRSPAGAGGRELLVSFMGGSSATAVLKIQYSASAGFSGGSPSATVIPTATDQQTLGTWSSGAAGPPAFFQLNGGSSFRMHVVADGVTPFGFAAFTYKVGGGDGGAWIVSDPLVSGTTETGDTDTMAFIVPLADGAGTGMTPGQLFNLADLSIGIGNGGCMAWHAKGLTAASFRAHLPIVTGFIGGTGILDSIITNNNNTSTSIQLVADAYASKDNLYPIVWVPAPKSGASYVPIASGNVKAIKGVSFWLKTIGRPGRNSGDTYTTSSTRDRIIVGQITFPWDGTVPTP